MTVVVGLWFIMMMSLYNNNDDDLIEMNSLCHEFVIY